MISEVNLQTHLKIAISIFYKQIHYAVYLENISSSFQLLSAGRKLLHNKMKYLIWLLWCCVLKVVSGETVLNPLTVTFFYDGAMYVKGSSVNSSYIKSLTADHTISKLYVYVADTFFADEDLTLNGIEELQIFANKWIVERPVTFDLSGFNGTNHEPTILKGKAGKPGNYGMDGGNFFGLANELINGENLTVMSNGGNGGDGQDGTANDDIYALFNGENGDGESGWFKQVDLHRYYEKYFNDKGYDVDISDVDDYTSMYAVFVHNKKISLNIRLHPRKCCGTTGKGGAGESIFEFSIFLKRAVSQLCNL